MKIIDLSQTVDNDMYVFPGDPKPNIRLIETLEKDDWNMRRIEISSHDGTHVNVPIHCVEGGRNLDDYNLENFVGESVLYESEVDIQKGVGLIFNTINIDWGIAKKIVEVGPKFVGLPAHFEFDIEIERYLLAEGVISFERLENTNKLSKKFFFHGAPLKIREGDGSPVRAYGVINL